MQLDSRASRVSLMLLSLSLLFYGGSAVRSEVMQHKNNKNEAYIQDCALNYTTTTPAGKVRNMRLQCRYNSYREHYFYEFMWDPPKSNSVLRYRFSTYVGSVHRCFQLPNTRRKFRFNESVGFLTGKPFKYTMVSQPVKRQEDGTISVEMMDAPACPMEPQLEPLQNIVVRQGQNVSFKCEFENPPFPPPRITWYFSSDKVACNKKQEIKNRQSWVEKGLALSKDKRTLHVLEASKAHVGCYTLQASNGMGDPQVEKGYLDLNMSTIIDPKKKPFWEAVGPLFGLLVGTVVLVVAAFVIVMYKCLNTPKFREVAMPLKPDSSMPSNRKVYISHCAVDEPERVALAQFASMIKSWMFEVVIDVCSEVQITDAGGFSRWIPLNMKSADKVIVVITPSYLDAVQSNSRDMHSMSKDVRKVNSEYNYITNILYNDLHFSKKVLIVAKGVKPSEFPFLFKNKFFIEFPEKLDVDTDMHFRSIMGVLLEEEPLQLKDGNPYVLTNS